MPYIRTGPMVRATGAESVVIWAQLSEACCVELRAVPLSSAQDADLYIRTTTVQVGGRYYIAAQLQGLQPSSWYAYSLALASDGSELLPPDTCRVFQCFRTFSRTGGAANTLDERAELRVAYGSCRKSEADPSDALQAFGLWLRAHYEQRDESWPHLLLLIGDQIYADEPPAELVRSYPHLSQGARTFEEFSTIYEYAWSRELGVRQAFACIPTYMIFDDHEVRNNWNVHPMWRSRCLRAGGEQLLVDALVAYWVYQGWGNLSQDAAADHTLLDIMSGGARSGEDVLEQLRACIKADVYNLTPIRWHYSIPTEPSVFVMNARTERTSLFTPSKDELYEAMRIMSREQMQDIERWLQAQRYNPPIMVSSVPILLPPLIGFLQYLMGIRLWTTPGGPAVLRWSGRRLASLQQLVANKVSFDHWPLYNASWREFVQVVTATQRQLVILSGDVHFSYSLVASPWLQKGAARLYQFVSTPLQNRLGESNAREVRLQALVTSIIYSGFRLRVLPLRATGTRARIYRRLLFENSLAFLSLRPTSRDGYRVQHEYMSFVDGDFRIVGSTELPLKM